MTTTDATPVLIAIAANYLPRRRDLLKTTGFDAGCDAGCDGGGGGGGVDVVFVGLRLLARVALLLKARLVCRLVCLGEYVSFSSKEEEEEEEEEEEAAVVVAAAAAAIATVCGYIPTSSEEEEE